MSTAHTRHRIGIRGIVQGVGFRPFVYALARQLGLSGSVANTTGEVVVEVEGPPAAVEEFARRVRADAPPMAVIEEVAAAPMPPQGGTEFTIAASASGAGRTMVSPDIATCDACVDDLTNPTNRRYRHPFVTCTSCGPRFTIIKDLPYDRATTTMAAFAMCSDCAREYSDPADRRFHAQPISCHACGPQLSLVRPGLDPTHGEAAMAEARRLLVDGAVVAVKGLGGYHLACDATNETAVAMLRKRKNRGGQPFAVMVADLTAARALAHLDGAAEALLTDHRRPIVLVERSAGGELAGAVAPGCADLGLMLPYTPVHHLLLGLPDDPPGPAALVMTSGNRSGEPIVTDDAESLERLAGLADAWLRHDRPIHVPCDDSVLRTVDGEEMPVRRSRGYAPFPVSLPFPVPAALATGGDLKNTFCVGEGHYAWLSAHVGDMDDLATLEAFDTAEQQLECLTGVRPQSIATDRHPAYRSRAWALRSAGERPVVDVQHHHAHVASTLAEHGHDGHSPVLGVAFDGTGYGDDGAVWGGEFLVADYTSYERTAHLAYVDLPGGDAGVANPCRMALSHLRAAGVAWAADLPSVSACSGQELTVLDRALTTGFGCAKTSSMGRLFDAVSSLAGVCHRVEYEAQAAIELEGVGRGQDPDGPAYAFGVAGSDGAGPIQVQAAPVIAAAAADVLAGISSAEISGRFHRGVVAMVTEVAETTRSATSIDTVTLSGGVFVNMLLSSWCARSLTERGFTVLRHRRVPPSDAGLALGQLAVLAATSTQARHPGRPPGGEEMSCA